MIASDHPAHSHPLPSVKETGLGTITHLKIIDDKYHIYIYVSILLVDMIPLAQVKGKHNTVWISMVKLELELQHRTSSRRLAARTAQGEI